jgi:hypothetical protein
MVRSLGGVVDCIGLEGSRKDGLAAKISCDQPE